MRCSKCGRENRAGRRFCVHCGAGLELTCPSCGARRLGTRLWEFWGLLTRIRALREIRGVEATREIEAALAEADAWIEMSGAKSYEPFLHVGAPSSLD